MRRPVSKRFSTLILFTLLLSLVPLGSLAQPTESSCPEGEVYLPDQDICVPESEVPPEPPPAPPVDVSAGTIVDLTLLHYVCDPGFDPRPARPSVGDRNILCTGAGKPAATYTVTINGQLITSATLQTSEGTRGRADLDSTPDQPLPAGTMVIVVEPVAGWDDAWVFCEIESYVEAPEVVEPQLINNAITITLAAEEWVTCDWFHTAIGAGEQATVEVVGSGDLVDVEPGESQTVDIDQAQGTGADITIATYYCPAGTTATADLIATCAERASGIEFALLTETTTVATQTSDAEGDIFFEDAPPADYGIAATLPSGYGEPIVFCYVADPIGNVFEGQQDVVFGNQIRLRLGDGFSAECAWYNVPAQGQDDGPNIYIQVRKCGEGIEITPQMTVFEAEQLCGVVYQNKEFQVLFNEETIATKQTNDDPLSSGQVFFTRLPAPNGGGIYGIQAALLQGEQTLGVFCDQNFGADAFHTVTTMVVDGNRIDQELLEGWTLRCSWFIEINPLLGGTQAAPSPSLPAEPELDPTSAAATQAALPPEPPALDPTSQAATAAAVAATPAVATPEDQAAGESDEEGSPGDASHTLTLEFRSCPEGTDFDTDRDQLADVCPVESGERSFLLTLDGLSTGETLTGPGTWEFQGSTVQLDIGAGTTSKVGCSSDWTEGTEGDARMPASSFLDGGLLTIDVPPAVSSVACNWYIFPD